MAFDARNARPIDEALVIPRTEEGFRVYAAADPTKSYIVTSSAEKPVCTCSDYQCHEGNPFWRCRHIAAVLNQLGDSNGHSPRVRSEVGVIATLATERDEELGRTTPYLSHSHSSRYLLCPEQYRLYYLESLRTKLAPASLVFGKVLHQALAQFFKNQGDPVQSFRSLWMEASQIDLAYKVRESWDKLSDCGQALLEKFVCEEAARITNVRGCEKTFELTISTLDLPFVGVIDLIADVDGVMTIIDFKTAAASYEDYKVILSDQLTAYQLAHPAAVSMPCGVRQAVHMMRKALLLRAPAMAFCSFRVLG